MATNMNTTEMPKKCSFYTPVNMYLVFVALCGLCLNIFPLFVCLRLRNMIPRSSRDVLLASLIVVDVLTVCVPLPMYLAMYDGCAARFKLDGEPGRPSICELFHLMFVWVKITALFIITTLNYTSYLAISSRARSVLYRSIGDRLSTSFSCSRERKRAKEARTSSIVIANLVVGIGLVAFLIASLPYLGLGPEKGREDIKGSLRNVCSLEQVSYPSKGKEYTFLFAVLMSTSACFLLQVVHNLTSSFSCRRGSRDSKEISQSQSDIHHVFRRQPCTDQSYAKLMCVMGLLFHLTWMPVMVAIGAIMSNYNISESLKEYVMAGAFINPCLDPLLYAAFVREFRDGYVELAQRIVSLTKFGHGTCRVVTRACVRLSPLARDARASRVSYPASPTQAIQKKVHMTTVTSIDTPSQTGDSV